MKSIILAAVILTIASKVNAQTGQICFIRATGSQGSLVNDRVFIDDSLACKLKNNSYSMHTVPVGQHTVSVNSGGLGGKKKSPSVNVTVIEGKINYIDVSIAKRLILQEITENTGSQKIKVLPQNQNCASD